MWNGSILPLLRKHRDGCGDITNHIQIKDYTLDQRFNIVRVTVGFREDDDQDYVYEFNFFESKDDLTDKRVMSEVVRQINNPEQDTSTKV